MVAGGHYDGLTSDGWTLRAQDSGQLNGQFLQLAQASGRLRQVRLPEDCSPTGFCVDWLDASDNIVQYHG